MIVKKEVAACLSEQAAVNNHLHSKAYRKDPRMSSENLTEFIGEILLYLQLPLTDEQTQKGWLLFEALLMQYVELRISRGSL